MTKRKAVQPELAAHLGHDKHETVANVSGNTSNGSSARTLKGDFGATAMAACEPQRIAKHQARWTGFDYKILSLYGHGLTSPSSGCALPDRLSRRQTAAAKTGSH